MRNHDWQPRWIDDKPVHLCVACGACSDDVPMRSDCSAKPEPKNANPFYDEELAARMRADIAAMDDPIMAGAYAFATGRHDAPIALSIRQPWSELVVLGIKDIENRSWSTPYRGKLLIHAPQTFVRWHIEEAQAICDKAGIKMPHLDPDKLKRGGVIGEAILSDVVTRSKSPWFAPSCFGFVLTDARRVRFQPGHGKLNLFRWNP